VSGKKIIIGLELLGLWDKLSCLKTINTKEDQTVRQVNTIMLELLKIFPRYEFEKLEKRYKGNYYTKYFTGWQQLIVLMFSQICGKVSIRDSRHHDIRVARSDKKLNFALLPDSKSR